MRRYDAVKDIAGHAFLPSNVPDGCSPIHLNIVVILIMNFDCYWKYTYLFIYFDSRGLRQTNIPVTNNVTSTFEKQNSIDFKNRLYIITSG